MEEGGEFRSETLARRWEGDVEEPKEKRQSEMVEDPPITVALVFPTIQSRREPTSPKRNLNLEAETRCTIFAPTIFTKLFNDKERERVRGREAFV